MWRLVCVLFLLAMSGSARADDFYQEVIYPLALNVYHEARGENELGKLMVAYITVKRAEANRSDWGGNTIAGVVYKKCQFSWTCDPHTRPPQAGAQWESALGAAALVATGLFTPPVTLANARFYMNPEASKQEAKCWFATSLKQVGVVGHHYFYAVGTPGVAPERFHCDA